MLSGNGTLECLEIMDVGCNLKQSDGLTCLTMIPDFATHLRHYELLNSIFCSQIRITISKFYID